MNHAGRKSAAELSVIRAATAFIPKAPADLSPEQASEWKAIVTSMPNGWFGRESYGLLVAYLRHCANARVIAAQIEKFNPKWLRRDDGLDRFDQLSKILLGSRRQWLRLWQDASFS